MWDCFSLEVGDCACQPLADSPTASGAVVLVLVPDPISHSSCRIRDSLRCPIFVKGELGIGVEQGVVGMAAS
jgi:hypothetical protein